MWNTLRKPLTPKQLETVNDCMNCECNDRLYVYKQYPEERQPFFQIGCEACGTRGPLMGTLRISIERWNYIMG